MFAGFDRTTKKVSQIGTFVLNTTLTLKQSAYIIYFFDKREG